MAQPRSRKRPRTGDDLDGLLEQFEASLNASPSEAQSLLLASQRLHHLQVAVEKRLAACKVDNLTPHEAVEFIYKRRVRLTRIAKNDFEDDEDGTDDEDGSKNGSKPANARRGNKGKWQLVVNFQIGKERLTVVCRAEGPLSSDWRYFTELRTGCGKGGEVLLRCFSWDQAACSVDLKAWDRLRLRFGVDYRDALDFARSVALLGVFAELKRRFAREESDSEDEGPGLVSTISICAMMAGAILPTRDAWLLAAHERGEAAPEVYMGVPAAPPGPGAGAAQPGAGAAPEAAGAAQLGRPAESTATSACDATAAGDAAAAGAAASGAAAGAAASDVAAGAGADGAAGKDAAAGGGAGEAGAAAAGDAAASAASAPAAEAAAAGAAAPGDGAASPSR